MFRTVRLFAASVVFSLMLGELMVRWFIPVRNVGPTFSEYDAEYGKRLKANLSCVRIAPEFRMQFTTNSLGFRGPEPSSFPEGGILFLGDSFTEGYGVSDGEEFPDLVRSTLAKHNPAGTIPVVNAGIGNLGTGRWIKFLRNEGKRLNPRFVVLQLSDNDFHDNTAEALFHLTENDSLVENSPRSPGSFRHIQKVIDAVPGLAYSYLVCLVRDVMSFTAAEPQAMPTEDEVLRKNQLTYRLIHEIVALCERNGWPVVLVSADLNEHQLDELASVVAEYKTPILRIPSKDTHPELYFEIDGHWNAKGHEYVAYQVSEYLKAYDFASRE
ncbi:MAG: SGNH/GDSL hydrolase family protein [Bacteroidetes bacterium]|nr:SGNH/GDSL hydrolase family protein [Bacteroidota bacterium]MCW5894310.1 SGNH/GDSL hydrolase family protein [Bacteroidota bacterium]